MACFFYIQLYFCRRGKENVERMHKATFRIGTDDEGSFLYQYEDEFNKNHQENDTEASIGGRIYATGEQDCSVSLFTKYVNKLSPTCERLWQYAKVDYLESDECWYTNKPIGSNAIAKIMHNISLFCKLSKQYTNHCIGVTSCTILGQRFEENDIKAVSMHKSSSALGT